MLNTIKKYFQKEKLTTPAIILILSGLAYGLLIPFMGFYWDDLPFAWLLHFGGPTEFIEAFRPFRPVLGPIFTTTTAIFGGNPIIWQIVGLLARFLLSIEFWFLLRNIWPSQKQNLLWATLLFTVYPGYQQQWVSLTHVNQEIIPLLCLLASFGLTAYALRTERYRKILTACAVVLQILGLFSTEYFFGLEILRFLFLSFIFAENTSEYGTILRKAAKSWLPYFIVWVLNAAWTYAYHHSNAYNSYEINIFSSTLLSPLAVGNEILTTISLSGFTSWLNTFQNFSIIDGSKTQLISLGIALFSASLIFMVAQLSQENIVTQQPAQDNRWSLQAILIGLAGIFAGRLPSWAAGLPLKLEFDYDRFMISIMLGASLFIVGLATFILKGGRRQIAIFSLLIGLSTAYQFNVANTYRRDWDNQQAFFWQLAWRMPNLEKDTVLLTSELPFKYASDLQLTAPLNWLYAPDLSERKLPYALLYVKTRYKTSTLPSLQPNEPIQFQYRTVPFSGSTTNSVVIYKDADGCLRVLDPVYGNEETVPGVSYFLLDAIRLSDPNRIQIDTPAPVMDKTIFGEEPEHTWCYYYEKAEIARQQLDWDQVVNLYEKARKNSLTPSTEVENLPFIEAFANSGDITTALKLTDATLKTRQDLCPAIYTLWDRVASVNSFSTEVFDMKKINDRIAESGCKRSK